MSEALDVTLKDLDTHYSLKDLYDFHEMLDIQEAYRVEQEKRNNP